MSNSKPNAATQALRALAEIGADRTAYMEPLSTADLQAKIQTKPRLRASIVRVGTAAAATLLIFAGMLGFLGGPDWTATEIPDHVVALVDSLYSSEGSVVAELAAYYVPQRVPAEENTEYLDDVWRAISNSQR